MKKIVIDAREWPTSTGRYIRELVTHLQEVDTDLSHRYYILMRPKDIDSWEPSSKRFTKVASRFKDFTFAEQIGLLWQLLVIQPDLVHFGMVQQPILYFGKVITTMHDLTTLRYDNPSKNPLAFWFKQRVYYWVNFIAAHKSKLVITGSEYVKDDVARVMRANSRKIRVTYEAAASYRGKSEAVPEFEAKQFIMYVGRPLPHKNLARLIEAFALLKQTMPELHLVLVGKEDSLFRRYAQDVEQQGIPDVHFTGFLPDAQVRWLHEHAAAYVFPSLSEGFGLPPLDAMTFGAPVVSSNATCLPEIYGPAAQYFNPRDVDDMADAIREVLTKPALRKKLIGAGRKQAAKYSWQRMAEQTLDAYRYVLGERKTSL